MAPNKKKNKKASTNPARGFATTSIVSKSKTDVEEITIADQENDPSEALAGASNLSFCNIGTNQADNDEIDLSKLTPEELESRLENEDLQLFVEGHGQKVKRDASRIASRLLTERRLIRGQAQPLALSKWIAGDLMSAIMQRIRDNGLPTLTNSRTSKVLSDDEFVVKLWTLKQAIQGLGFSKELSLEAAAQLAKSPLLVEQATSEEVHDGVWGLGVCLDWLGMSCEESELPGYHSRPAVKKRKIIHARKDAAISLSETASTVSSASGTATPDTAPSEASQNQNGTNIATAASNGPANGMASNHGLEEEDDEYEDLDPREMLDKFISLMTKLHQRRPDLTELAAPPKRKGATKQKPALAQPDVSTARLLKKIRKIESDILFDKEDAEDKWRDIRITLVRDAAERKKLDLNSSEPSSKVFNQTTRLSEGAEASEEADAAMNLGDFFASLPQEQPDNSTGAKGMTVVSTEGSLTTVRDFGKWVGVHPRRTLEETCRARDSSVKVALSLISASSFSNRHSLKVSWSKPQDLPDETDISGVKIQADERNVQLEMSSISAPDKAQSEAFISTVALFLIFVPSTKEEKAYLRLPAVFRDLWMELSAAREERLNAIDREEVRLVRRLVESQSYKHTRAAVPKDSSKTASTYGQTQGAEGDANKNTSHADFGYTRSIWSTKSSTPYYQRMLSSRKQLPVWAFKGELLQTIEKHQAVIVCGETGCGKSTQVPSFVLERELSQGRDCKIYCTEPRRISAISLARRVSEELGERKNDVGTPRSLVGYAIRLENQVSSGTKLVYATTGIVMRMLENPEAFDEITHIILDEVHERSIDGDFLLVILRKLLGRKPSLKVILMSATVDAEKFSRYLNGAPVLSVPGRTYPVETKFLEDAIEAIGVASSLQSLARSHSEDLEVDEEVLDEAHNTTLSGNLDGYSAQTKKFIAQFNEYRIDYGLIVKLLEVVATSKEYEEYSKAILVFLPGLAEIRRVNDMLVGHPIFSRHWQIFPLHSTIATEAQEAAFQLPPRGYRKIVLATNIAETGITIPDITCVIDSGKHREMRFDERRQLSRLLEAFISKANAKQRRGRAGRVQNGLCFHLFTRARHDTILADQQTPEMLRLSLQDLSLRVKIYKLGAIEEVLREALDPPTPKNVRRAIDSLIEVKALTADEELTTLGSQLTKLPLDVYLGKLVLYASIFKCVDAGLTIAAILSSKSPFSAPIGARSQADQARLAFKKGDSDLMTVYNAYCAWRRICRAGAPEYQFCRRNFLVPQTLANIEDLKSQLASALVEAGFLTSSSNSAAVYRTPFSAHQKNFVEVPTSSDTNASNELVLNSVIAWSFYPKLLSRDGQGWRNVSSNQNVSLHPGSVNKGCGDPPRWLSFYHIMQSGSKSYNAIETSPAEDVAVALVCGEAEFKMYAGVLVIDGNRIRFSLPDWQSLLIIKMLRLRMQEIISQALRSPSKELSTEQQVWFDIWQQMFAKRSALTSKS